MSWAFHDEVGAHITVKHCDRRFTLCTERPFASFFSVFSCRMRSVVSYTIPLLQHINAQPHLDPGDGPIVLVLCPTKESAESVQETCTRYGRASGIKNTAIIGGTPKGPQIRNLAKGALRLLCPSLHCTWCMGGIIVLTRKESKR